jgi:hypothetical protein
MAATKNTLVVLDSTTIATNIKPAYIAELMQCSKVTGKSLSQLLYEAVNDFMNMKAPVYMNSADPTTWDWMKRPTVRQHAQPV